MTITGPVAPSPMISTWYAPRSATVMVVSNCRALDEARLTVPSGRVTKTRAAEKRGPTSPCKRKVAPGSRRRGNGCSVASTAPNTTAATSRHQAKGDSTPA